MKIKAKSNGRGAQFGDRVVPACLPHMNVVYGPHLNCSVYGWGSMNSNDPKFARYLQSTKMPYLDTEQCIKPQVYGPKKLSSGMFCAGYLEGGKLFFSFFSKNCDSEIHQSLIKLSQHNKAKTSMSNWKLFWAPDWGKKEKNLLRFYLL